MNCFFKAYCRTYQFFLKILAKCIKWPKPQILNNFQQASEILKEKNAFPVLIVSGKTVSQQPFFNELVSELKDNKIPFETFCETTSDPDTVLVEKGAKFFKEKNCKSVIAIGGGSVIDCAKAIMAVAATGKDIKNLRGILKVRKKLPLFIAVPTTAGTGSEATAASVIINRKNKDKYSIIDTVLIPSYALLDFRLISNLSQRITASSGMDALTHAVEAYIGKSGTPFTDECALKSIKLISENLLSVYNREATDDNYKNMLYASFYAGLAFTRAYVGPVHAAAHSVGGFASVPHGVACAATLPLVLRKYGAKAYQKLSEIADYISLAEKSALPDIKAEKFIQYIEELNFKLDIEDKFKLNESEFKQMAAHAFQESNPLYPSPVIFSKKDYLDIFNKLNFKEAGFEKNS